MSKTKIWVNTIVHNEENFIWFAIMSVIDYVDKVLVWDTGSTDRTVDIIREIREIKGDKVDFKEVGPVDKYEFTKMRQKMLDESDCDWILILDGDEIWWRNSIKDVVDQIQKDGSKIESIIVPIVVAVGDIYHRQKETAGKYEILGRKGHLSLRAFSKDIPGLYVDLPYGKEGFFDGNKQPIQKRQGAIFLDAPYLHATHLRRSSSRRKFDKFKHELGIPTPKDFKFPEVLYEECPRIISSPWSKITGIPLIKAKLLTPLRRIKRKFL